MTPAEAADRVAQVLAVGTYSETLVVSREFVPQYAVADLAVARASVVPAAEERTRVSRGAWRRRHRVEVGVQRRVADLSDEVEEMVSLVAEVADRLQEVDPEGLTLVAVEVSPLYSSEHLRDQQVFTAVVRCEYEEVA